MSAFQSDHNTSEDTDLEPFYTSRGLPKRPIPPKPSKPNPAASLVLIGNLRVDCPTTTKTPKTDTKKNTSRRRLPGRTKGDPVFLRREPHVLFTCYSVVDESGRQVRQELVELLSGVNIQAEMRDLDTVANREERRVRKQNDAEMKIYQKELAAWEEIEAMRAGRTTPTRERSPAANTTPHELNHDNAEGHATRSNPTNATASTTPLQYAPNPSSHGTRNSNAQAMEGESSSSSQIREGRDAKRLRPDSDLDFWFN